MKLTVFVLIPIVALLVAISSAILYGRDNRSTLLAVLSLAVCGLCVLIALLMQLATGSTQGISWWFVLSGFFFALAFALFAAKRPVSRWIYLLTFFSAVSTGIGIGFVVEADLKAHRDANYLR